MHNPVILSYFFSSSIIVQIVILILLLASLASWTIIFQRTFYIGRARRGVKRFEKTFWKAKDLNAFYKTIEKKGDKNEGLAAIFHAGYHEFLLLRKRYPNDTKAAFDGVQRIMRAAVAFEEDELESHLAFLGTVGSTSPYIGLFGTVWGIMMAFHALGTAQQVTIAMVAPGISEALVATAVGLFAAIPAVIFYNRFVNRTDRILNRYDAFQEEFISLLHRTDISEDAHA
jgi:biopolymer transport protein TolQ